MSDHASSSATRWLFLRCSSCMYVCVKRPVENCNFSCFGWAKMTRNDPQEALSSLSFHPLSNRLTADESTRSTFGAFCDELAITQIS